MQGEIKARTVRKLMWRLIPFTGLLFFINYIDRANIGFAALKMNDDLGFSGAVYGLGAGVFFISYALLEIPSNLILNRVGPRIWIARIMITWGIISMAFALIQSATAFYALRFLLGAAEAGFVPGIVLYFARWFPAEDRGKAFAAFFGAANLSSIIGAPLSAYILTASDGFAGLKGWQWLFVVEGLPAVLMGLVTLGFLTERPEQARWLEPEERDWLVAQLEYDRQAAPSRHASVGEFLRDGRVLALTGIYFFYAVSVYGVLFWLPLIIKGFGNLTTQQIGFLTAVPYLCAFIAMQVVAIHSDRTGERRMHVAGSALLGAVGLAASAYAPTPTIAFILICIAAMGIWGQNGVFWTLPTTYLTGAAAAGGIAFINCIAQFGGFLGPYAVGWVKDATGSFAVPLLLLAGSSLLVSVIAMSLRQSRPASRLAPPVPTAT